MASVYYLTSGNQKLGPLSEKHIIDGVRSGKISLFDLILNNQTGEWIMLAQHPDFSDIEDSGDSERSSDDGGHFAVGLISNDISDDHTNIPGFVARDEFSSLTPVLWYEKDKPQHQLSFLDVLELLHAKKISEQSLISKNPDGPWQPLIKWEEFSPTSLEQYKATNQNLPEVHVRRQSERFNCGKIFVAFHKGQGFQVYCADISKAGLSFLARSAKCEVNEELMLKFADKINDGKFDAKGVVVSVRKARLPGNDNTYFRYGIRFTGLSETGKKIILGFIK